MPRFKHIPTFIHWMKTHYNSSINTKSQYWALPQKTISPEQSHPDLIRNTGRITKLFTISIWEMNLLIWGLADDEKNLYGRKKEIGWLR